MNNRQSTISTSSCQFMGQLTQFAKCVKEITVLHHEAYVSTVKGMQQTKKKKKKAKWGQKFWMLLASSFWHIAHSCANHSSWFAVLSAKIFITLGTVLLRNIYSIFKITKSLWSREMQALQWLCIKSSRLLVLKEIQKLTGSWKSYKMLEREMTSLAFDFIFYLEKHSGILLQLWVYIAIRNHF